MSRDLHSCPVLHAVSHTSHSSLHFVHMSRTSLSIQLRTLRSCPALLSRALHSRMLVSCILRWCSAPIASVPHLTQLSRLFTRVRGLLLISRTSSSFPVLHSYFAFPFHTLHCACFSPAPPILCSPLFSGKARSLYFVIATHISGFCFFAVEREPRFTRVSYT